MTHSLRKLEESYWRSILAIPKELLESRSQDYSSAIEVNFEMFKRQLGIPEQPNQAGGVR